jgi:hypothetical protein
MLTCVSTHCPVCISPSLATQVRAHSPDTPGGTPKVDYEQDEEDEEKDTGVVMRELISAQRNTTTLLVGGRLVLLNTDGGKVAARVLVASLFKLATANKIDLTGHANVMEDYNNWPITVTYSRTDLATTYTDDNRPAPVKNYKFPDVTAKREELNECVTAADALPKKDVDMSCVNNLLKVVPSAGALGVDPTGVHMHTLCTTLTGKPGDCYRKPETVQAMVYSPENGVFVLMANTPQAGKKKLIYRLPLDEGAIPLLAFVIMTRLNKGLASIVDDAREKFLASMRTIIDACAKRANLANA